MRASIGRTLLLVLLPMVAAVAQAQIWMGPAALEVRAEDGGKPAAGGEVRLEYLDMEPTDGPAPVPLDSRGRAVIGSLAEGHWRLEVSRQGAMTYRAEVLVRADGKPQVINAVQHNVPGAVSMMEVKLARARGGAAPPPRVAAAPPRSEPARPNPAPIPPAPREEAPAPAPIERETPTPAPVPQTVTPPPVPMPIEREAPTPAPAPATPPPAPRPEPREEAPTPAPQPAPPPPAPVPEREAPTPAPAPATPPPPPAPRPEPRETPRPVQPPAPAPQRPAPAPAPQVTPPSPAPAPPAAATGRRSHQDRTCAECKPGEAALSIEVTAPPASGATGCGDGLREALLRRDVTGLPAGCRMLRLELPPNSRYIGYRYEVQEAAGGAATNCEAGKDCPSGDARWPMDPLMFRDGTGKTTVSTAFENRSADRERRAVLTIYYKEAGNPNAPRPMLQSRPRQPDRPPG